MILRLTLAGALVFLVGPRVLAQAAKKDAAPDKVLANAQSISGNYDERRGVYRPELAKAEDA